MATNSLCIMVTEPGGLFVGPNPTYLAPFIEKQKIKKEVWQIMPYGLQDFFKQNPKEKETFFKALHYWALCALGREEYNENKYGLIKRKLHKFKNKLYRRVRNFAHTIAKVFKESFLSQEQQSKMEKKFFAFVDKQKKKNPSFVVA